MSKSLVQNQRIITKKGVLHGREVLGFFAVIEESSGYSVRLVDVRYVGKEEVVALPKAKSKSPFVVSIKSIYFPSAESFVSDFSFVSSQPTRGPNSK